MDNLQAIINTISQSNGVVCLFGTGVSADCGCFNYRDMNTAMEVESEYGYSPEEIFSSSFYVTRTKQFFEYYQKYMLSHLGTPGTATAALARMERDGKLLGTVTRELFSIARRGGCKNVVELHGSVYDNKCPRCGKHYTVDDMKKGQPVPLCETCNIAIRPHVCLVGEMIDNSRITRAADLISRADTLLVLGAHLQTLLCETCVKYFHGKDLILINNEPHFSDRKADLVYIGRPTDVVPLIYPAK